MTKVLLFFYLIFSASAFAHVSDASGDIHQAEHFLWALAIVSVIWAVMPMVENLKQRAGKR